MSETNPLPRPPYFDASIWGENTWPLLSAAYTGDNETIVRILDADPSAVRAQFAYYEPLHFAVRGGNPETVKLLLDRGGDPLAPGWSRRLGDDSPLAKAIDRERSDLVALLEKSATPVVPRIEQPEYGPDLADSGLYEAFHHADVATARRLVAEGVDVNRHMPFACWFTPLMHCLRYPEPRWELAELLLDHGVPIDSTNGLGMTALHIVVLHDNRPSAQWLLDRGASIDAIEPELGSTPLGWAARWGFTEMAKQLLARGADPALPQDQAWAQPRRWAIKKNHPEVLALLVTNRPGDNL